jgi:thymidylate kinase
VRRGSPGLLPGSDLPAARDRAFRRGWVRALWLAMAEVDMLVEYAIMVRAHLVRGRTVICDRYLDDAVLDLRLRFPGMQQAAERATSFVASVSPRPDRALLLLLPSAEVALRMRSKPEPFPDPPELRQQRHHAYERLAASGNYTVVDANADVDTVHEAIMSAVLAGDR